MVLTRRKTPRANSSDNLSPGILKLSVELQEFICIYYFASTRLTFGERLRVDEEAWLESDEIVWNKVITQPKPNSLALLHTCRQLRAVARSLWLKHVLFNFDSTLSMLRVLAIVPQTIPVQEIRHIRVAADSNTAPPTKGLTKSRDLFKYGCTKGRHIMHPPELLDRLKLCRVMEMLPELHLDTLTVLIRNGASHSRRNLPMENLATLIQRGHGWKELRMVCPNPMNLVSWANARDFKERTGLDWTWPDAVDAFIPLFHPSGCRELLLKRDGDESGASLEVYLGRNGRYEYDNIDLDDLDTWEHYELRTPIRRNENVQAFFRKESLRWVHGVIDRPALIVVKRGTRSEKSGRALRSSLQRQGWKVFRERHIDPLFPETVTGETRLDQYDNRGLVSYDEGYDRWI